jgi:hypothetical protein
VFQKLVSRNKDLNNLVEKGYAVAFDGGYLIVRDIPYLNDQGQLQSGAIVTKLEFVDQDRVIQSDHQIFFAGSVPHNLDRTPIKNLGGGPVQLALSDTCKDVVVQRSFSNKPTTEGKFHDFYEKIESYVAIISGPAMHAYKDVSPYTFRAQKDLVRDSVFKFSDTLTSRAEITDLAAKFKNDVIAVVGLGGTGAYVLDFLVKMPVRDIRAFDLDKYHVHNAFRSPGSLEPSELGKTKAEVYQSRYDNFRTGLFISPKFVDTTSGDALDGVTFAFVCVDKGLSRAGIFDMLLSKRIPFIDVGMDLKRRDGTLNGMLRTTLYSADHGQKVREMGLAELNDTPDDLYKVNI